MDIEGHFISLSIAAPAAVTVTPNHLQPLSRPIRPTVFSRDEKWSVALFRGQWSSAKPQQR